MLFTFFFFINQFIYPEYKLKTILKVNTQNTQKHFLHKILWLDKLLLIIYLQNDVFHTNNIFMLCKRISKHLYKINSEYKTKPHKHNFFRSNWLTWCWTSKDHGFLTHKYSLKFLSSTNSFINLTITDIINLKLLLICQP